MTYSIASRQQPLLNLCHLLAIAPRESEVRSRVMDRLGALFAANAWGIAFFDPRQGVAELDLKGLPDTFVDRHAQMGWQSDPLVCAMVEQHSPVHNLSVLSDAAWQQTVVFQELWSRYGMAHGLIAPILGGGEIIGKVHCLRTAGMPPFDAQDLQRMGVLSAHLSVCVATLRSQPSFSTEGRSPNLTPRELQIVDLVGKGLSNAQIAAKLGISQNGVKQALKRMFLKHKVSARAELVAKVLTT